MEQDRHGLGVKQPVAVWNRPLSIKPKRFFLDLAKAAVNGTKLELDDAFENLMDALQSIDAKDKAGQVAWVLVYRALSSAMADLVLDSTDLFELAEQPPDEAAQAKLSDVLNDHLAHCNARIDTEFFERPERFGLLTDFQPGFRHWLLGLGLDAPQASALVMRLPYRFVLALHEEWSKNPEHYAILLEAVDSPFTKAVSRRRQWLRYTAWLREQVNARMFAEAFSLQQVYVPLRAYYEKDPQEDDTKLHDDSARNLDLPARRRSLQVQRVVVDLHQKLRDWVTRFDPHDTVRFISGGPGSGKSSFTKMFAAEISEEQGIPVLYVPLHLLDPKVDLVQAVAGFAANDRHLRGSPLDASDGEERLLVIFDGLDELSMQGRAAAEVAQQFVDEVRNKTELFAAQRLQRQFLISGRDLPIQAIAHQIRDLREWLHVLPFFVDEYSRMHYTDGSRLLAEDQRDRWWQLFGRVAGEGFASMPDDLRIDSLTDITSQPLLNYLVSLSHRYGQLDFSRETTRNEVYADLLRAVYKRQWEGGRRQAYVGELKEKNFDRILEEIALAVWHGDGPVATVDTIYQRCKDSKLDHYLEQFQKSAEEGVTRLLTAFYFRQAGKFRAEKTFEFTHKSFGEYLTARRLVRIMDHVQTQLEQQFEDPEYGWNEREALRQWARVCGPTAIDKYVNAFLRNEIALRRADRCELWQKTICRLIESSVTHSMPMETLNLPSFREMSRQSRNAEEALLVMHAACAMNTGEVFPVEWPSPTTFGEWLKRLQGPRTGPENPLVLRSLVFLYLSGCSLGLSDLYEADFTGANLQKANLQGANLQGANLRGADLQQADLQNTNLQKADLQGAKLQNANLRCADLRGTNLQGADLQGAKLHKRAHLQEANLQGANLREANLLLAYFQEACLRTADLWGTNLRGANLREADLQKADLQYADLQKANLLYADLQGATLQGVDLQGADLRGANLREADLQKADLQKADLQEADLQKADLQEADLRGTNLQNAYLWGANLQDADLQEVDLQEADLQSTDLRAERVKPFPRFRY